MSRVREIMKQVGLYASASYVTQLLAVIAGILTRNFLGPFAMGIWATVQLVMSYCEYSSLGIDAALSREYPYYIGRGDKDKADRVKNLVMSFGLLTSGLAAVAVLIGCVFLGAGWPRYVLWGILAVPVFLVLQRFNNFIVAWLRASKQFEIASFQIVASGFVNLALILIFVSSFGFIGLLLSIFFSLVFNAFFLIRKSHFSFRFCIEREVGRLISFGLPLTVLAVLFDLLRSIDKMLVIRFLGFEQMGIYGVATMAAMLVAKIPDSIVIVLIPHFHEKFGEREKAEDLRRLVDQSASAYSLIMPLVIGVAWICAAPFVHFLLPKFTSAVPAMKLLLLSMYFFALFYPYSNFLIAVKRHLVLFPMIVVILLVQLAATWGAIRSGYGLSGVAVVSNACYLMSFLGLFVLAARSLYGWRTSFSKLSALLLPFVGLVSVLLALDRWMVLSSLLWTTFFQLFCFMLCSVPLFVFMQIHFGLFDHVRSMIHSKTSKRNAVTL